MQENNKETENTSWESVEKYLASEIIGRREEVSKAKGFAIVCLTVALIGVTATMAIINYKNDCDWRDLFSSYDYVSQDGEGYNYYNSDIGGNVSNGSENQKTEKQK